MPHEMPPFVASATSLARGIASHLVELGVTTVFGVPGGPIMGLLEAISKQPKLRCVLCRHEQGAVFAAYGHAWRSRRPAVVLATSGPGGTNCLTALAAAFHDRVPILVLTGQVARDQVGIGAAQDSSASGTDLISMARPVTVASASATTAPHALRLVGQLFERTSLASRPCLLQLPADLLSAPVTVPSLGHVWRRMPRPFDVAAAQAGLAHMRKAHRLAFLVGSGTATELGPLLVSLAERLGAAVATTPKGKGRFPEDHPHSVGVFGLAGWQWADHCLKDVAVDVLVVLGSSLGETATDGFSPMLRPRRMLHVDIDPMVIGRNYPADPIVGDVAAVLRSWLRSLDEQGPSGSGGPESPGLPRAPRWLSFLKTTTPRVVPKPLPAQARPPAGTLTLEQVFDELQAALPRDALVVSDIGNAMAYAIHYLQLSEHQDFVVNLGLGCMGHAPAAALGCQLAQPERPIVALVGDAAFAMGGFEVHTASELSLQSGFGLSPVLLVLNDGGNGMVEAGARAQFGHEHGIQTGRYQQPMKIAAIARGLGARTASVTRLGQLAQVLQRALHEGGGPTVVEVVAQPGKQVPIGARVSTLKCAADGGRRHGV